MSAGGADIVDRVSAYDDDIYAWSQEQAAALRRLAETRRDLPNELDLENVAEEIEDVGKSELRTVESFAELMLRHLVKLASAPEAPAAEHWVREVEGQRRALVKSVKPSLIHKLDMDDVWFSAVTRAGLGLTEHGDRLIAGLPARCPITIDQLTTVPFDVEAAAAALAAAATRSP